MVSYILAVITAVAALALDQFTKYYISNNFVMAETKPLIPHVLGITYVYNTGGAWGMLKDQTWLLLSVTIVIMLVCN